MNIKKLTAALLALCLVFGLCACGVDSDKDPKETTTETKGSSAGNTVTTPTQPEVTEPAKEPSYTVKVVDEGGNPIVGAMVMICQGENCTIATTEDTGAANFYDKPEAEYEVKFAAMPSGYSYISEEQVFHFPAGSNELTITLQAIA